MKKKKRPIRLLAFLFAASLVVQSCDTDLEKEIDQSAAKTQLTQTSANNVTVDNVGFQGVVYNDAITQTIPNAIITFSRSDINDVTTVVSDAYGIYKVALNPGTYYVTATATGYNSYSSAPGYFVVTGVDGYQTGNFFLQTEAPSGFQGFVFNSNDFNITIPNTFITFSLSSNPSIVYSVYSGAAGEYKINLPAGGYYVRAEAADYDVYDTTPGLFVANGSSYQTGNIFLTPSKVKKVKKPKKHLLQ